MYMKKLLTLSALFVGLGFSAIAQDSTKQVQPEIRQEVNQKKHLRVDRKKNWSNKTAEEIAQMRTDRMDKSLAFTDEQKEQVYAYHLKQAGQRKARIEEQKALRQARMQEAKVEREAFEKILTPEQQQKLSEIVEAKKGEFRKGDRKFRRRAPKHRKMEDKAPVEKNNVAVEGSNS
ncbi:MAG: hypothetical protein ACTHZ1_02175 [Sphingobacterium sp.]